VSKCRGGEKQWFLPEQTNTPTAISTTRSRRIQAASTREVNESSQSGYDLTQSVHHGGVKLGVRTACSRMWTVMFELILQDVQYDAHNS
jgi:hypothetical protein